MTASTPRRCAANLIAFLREVAPVAEACGVTLVIHPDDPPFSLFGLPRVVSGAEDLRALFAAVPSPANGMTLCTGSYGAGPAERSRRHGGGVCRRIHFAHLRNVKVEADGSFYESDHLDGRVDMVAVIERAAGRGAPAQGERRRSAAEIVMRPDHGHVLIDDIGKKVNPGYSCIGRLKGLAELRGVITALESSNDSARRHRSEMATNEREFASPLGRSVLRHLAAAALGPRLRPSIGPSVVDDPRRRRDRHHGEAGSDRARHPRTGRSSRLCARGVRRGSRAPHRHRRGDERRARQARNCSPLAISRR